MKNTVAGVLLFLCCVIVFADTVTGQNSLGNNHYTLICDQTADCTVMVKNSETASSATFHQDGLALINKTNLIWHGDNILELQSSFGSGLAYSYFINFWPIQLSDQFFNASYINTSKKIAIVQDQNTDLQYLMVCIFNNTVSPQIILKDAIMDLGSINALNPNQISFNYYDQNDHYDSKVISSNLVCTNS